LSRVPGRVKAHQRKKALEISPNYTRTFGQR